MPIYEYVCSKCGTFEQIQKVSDSVLKKCPTCRRKVTKKISTPALHFKGEGFWVTDYGWKSKNKDGGPSAGAPGSGDGGGAKEGGAKEGGAKEGGATESTAKESSSGSKAGGATESAAPKAPTTGTDARRPKAKAAKGS